MTAQLVMILHSLVVLGPQFAMFLLFSFLLTGVMHKDNKKEKINCSGLKLDFFGFNRGSMHAVE
jgi:hypothetical protein